MVVVSKVDYQTELEERLRFETLMVDLTARFLSVPAECVDQEIQDAQRRICECLGIDHSSFWQVPQDDHNLAFATHFHRDPTLPPMPRLIGRDFFPWAYAKIIAKEILSVPDTAKLPSDAAKDMESWRQFGIGSCLAIPLSVGGGPVIGALTFEATGKPRDWPESLQKRLQLVARVFASALKRKQSEQELRESEARLSLAADSANAGLWTLEPESGHIWATDKTHELFGLSPGAEISFDILLAMIHLEDRETVRQVIRKAMTSGNEEAVEYRIVRHDGEVRWISSRGRRQPGSDGSSDRLMGVSTDITEAKRVQQELGELRKRLQAESDYLKEEIEYHGGFAEMIGQSKAISKVFERIEQVALADSTVLITGETGTGKELVARAIHGLSRRKDRVMVKVDCSSLPSSLIEAELFGREKGAYTGALTKQVGRFEFANGSTIFLDEIGELPLELQAKLLRVVQDGEFERLGTPKTIHVDVRVIAATNRDLAEKVRNGAFREDLFYRLNVFPIHVPPLRERIEDVPLLAETFVREFERKMGRKISSLSRGNIQRLQAYSWPGNVRQLRNVIEQAIVLSNGGQLNLQIPEPLGARPSPTLKQAECLHILAVLEKTGWRVKGPHGAAELLDMNASTLFSTMHRLGITTKSNRV